MPSGAAMGLFRSNVPNQLIRIHPDNATSKDWLILLEAGTIVGPSPERLRVARSTLERKIVKKYNIWLQPSTFSSLKDMILAFTPYIFALNSTNMILTKSLSLYRARKSAV